MPLIKCPDCGRDVSDAAPACIGCGRPLFPVFAPVGTASNDAPRRAGALGVAAVVATLLIAAVGGSVLVAQKLKESERAARRAEVETAVADIAKQAAAAYEKQNWICESASTPVPTSADSVKGRAYQSTAADWTVDHHSNSGFACIGFSLVEPQHYQYDYSSTTTSFEVDAYGDLNGDGVRSTFRVKGATFNGALAISETITEISPDE